MSKTIHLQISGLMIIASGVILLLSSKLGVSSSKMLLAASFMLAGTFSLLFSKYGKLPKIANQYHMIQGFGLIVYAIILLFAIGSLESFLLVTTYFVLIFGLFELMFAFSVMNSNHEINRNILFVRLASAVFSLIGGFILLMTSLADEISGVQLLSILIMIGGFSLIIFGNRLKVKENL